MNDALNRAVLGSIQGATSQDRIARVIGAIVSQLGPPVLAIRSGTDVKASYSWSDNLAGTEELFRLPNSTPVGSTTGFNADDSELNVVLSNAAGTLTLSTTSVGTETDADGVLSGDVADGATIPFAVTSGIRPYVTLGEDPDGEDPDGGDGGSDGQYGPADVDPGPVTVAAPPGAMFYTLWETRKFGTMVCDNAAWNVNNSGLAGQVTQGMAGGPSTSDRKNSFRIYFDVPTPQEVPRSPNAGTEVVTYPSVHWGQPPGYPNTGSPNIPILLKDIEDMWLGFKSLSFSASPDCVGHVSHDMRTMSTGQVFPNYAAADSSIRSELFIVGQQFGGYGVHPNGRSPSWYRGTYTIGGFDWYVYIQPGASNTPQIIWMPVGELPNPLNAGPLIKWGIAMSFEDLDVNPMIDGDSLLYGRPASAKLINENEWFTSNAMGTEAVQGELDLTMMGAYFRVNEKLPPGALD